MTISEGWYPDPERDFQLRWWSGSEWTAYTRVKPPAPDFTRSPETHLPRAADPHARPHAALRKKLGFVVVGAQDWSGERENLTGLQDDDGEDVPVRAVLTRSPSVPGRVDVTLLAKVDDIEEVEHVGYLSKADTAAIEPVILQHEEQGTYPSIRATVTEEGRTLEGDPIFRVTLR